MKFLILFMILGLSLFQLVDAIETESGTFFWKFCNEEKEFSYEITNGTLRDTAHLKLHNTHHCEEGTNPTDYQLQLWHTSNNQTDFTMIVPDDLDFEKINVQIIDREYVESSNGKIIEQRHIEFFVLNDTHRTMQFSDFTHDKHGDVNIILDFMGIKKE